MNWKGYFVPRIIAQKERELGITPMKVTPLGNRILVRPLPRDEKAGESIFYAPQHRPEQQIHVVLAVGTGKKLKNGTIVEMPVKAGDHVMLDQYSINNRTEAGEDVWIVDLDHCSLVVSPEPTPP